jgi:glycerol-3-phosphate dehydrogenase
VTDPDGAPLERRRRDLRALADEPWDLVVVGGGIVGAGILLDATARGLRAALIEQEDIAWGTSSRSSRLIHGGLRYLEQFHVGLVREALAERARLLDLAPHLVKLRPLVFPLYGLPGWTRMFYGAGIGFYDLLGSARRGGRSRHLGVRAVLELAPPLRTSGLRGGIVYHDAVEDDARFTLAVVRTAQAMGGRAVTRARAIGLRTEGRRAIGLEVEDRLSGDRFDLRAKHLIDATGVWQSQPDGPFPGGLHLVPSRGAHLVVPRERIPVRHGMTIRVPGKVVFLVPWPEFWLVGTTDGPDDGPPERPVASADEVDHLIGTVNHSLAVDLGRDDVVGTFAGLRPLVGDARDGATVKVSREHRIRVDPSGLVRVSGGKYTTYRIMAADAVDAALGADARARPSATADLPIRGAAARADLDRLVGRLVGEHDLDAGAARRLVDRHGTEAADVVALGASTGLLGPIIEGRPHLEAEVVWAVREEGALSLDDVLARRTRLATELRDRGESIAERVAGLVGAELGWDAARRSAEIGAYLETARREYGVPPAARDHT